MTDLQASLPKSEKFGPMQARDFGETVSCYEHPLYIGVGIWLDGRQGSDSETNETRHIDVGGAKSWA